MNQDLSSFLQGLANKVEGIGEVPDQVGFLQIRDSDDLVNELSWESWGPNIRNLENMSDPGFQKVFL